MMKGEGLLFMVPIHTELKALLELFVMGLFSMTSSYLFQFSRANSLAFHPPALLPGRATIQVLLK